MENFINNLRNLGTGRLISLGILGVVIIATIMFAFNTITKPVMSPLYSGLDPSDSAAIVRNLEQSNIQVEVSADGSVVNIPRESFSRARMLLAEQGLPGQGTPGWELFDTNSSLGMTSFMQRVNRLRAMEGELARSIQTIKGVEAARVHLVLPEREAFSRDRMEPSASVIIRSSGNYTVEKNQALAIRHLVSSAVPDLAPTRVTVLSANGEVILSDDGSGEINEVTMQSMKSQLEDRYARAIENILTARVGAGNARVNVNVELSSERETIISERFDPEQQVVRSTETSEESEEGSETGNSSVSVANNIPNANDASASGSRQARNRIDEIVNYEIGNVKSEKIIEPGKVQKVSVAVLVNGIYDVDADGGVEYRDRPDDELIRLSDLVKTAIGFDDNRGDSVSVDSLRFIDYSMDVGEPVGTSIMDILAENIMSIVQWIAAIIMVALIMLLGVRPVLNRVMPAPVVDAEEEENQDSVTENGSVDTPDGAVDGADVDSEGGVTVVSGINNEEDDFVSIMSVQGGVRAKRLKALTDVVDENRQEAIKVIRGWIAPEVM